MLKILLADEQVIVREGIKVLLHAQTGIQVIGDAATGKELIEMINNGIVPDMVWTDLNSPEMDGINLIKTLNSQWPEIKIMVLTGLRNEKCISKAFSEGCFGYLLKHVTQDEMLFAIKTIASGRRYLCNELSDKLLDKMLKNIASESIADQNFNHISLTTRELDVLQLLSEGYTNVQIADKLDLSKRTVEGHRQSLIDKTDSKNTASLIGFAVRNGFIKYLATS
ncbi:DNA-binding NarL/FixJ family response regulator [Pedobacter sp. UYEF25]